MHRPLRHFEDRCELTWLLPGWLCGPLDGDSHKGDGSVVRRDTPGGGHLWWRRLRKKWRFRAVSGVEDLHLN